MIGGRAVNWTTRAGRIVGNHSGKRCAGARGDIRSKTKSVRSEEIVKLIQHDTGAYAHATFFDIEFADLPVMTREIDDQSLADRAAGQACARASWND